jgi:hypothetical protein
MFSLNIFEESQKSEFITEAVFKDGKNKIKPIQDSFDKLARVYSTMKKGLNGYSSTYDNHVKFYKDDAWKELEKSMIEILGVRSIVFDHMSMRSGHAGKYWLNCYTYTNMYDRFPIDSLISDAGFYDQSHTLMCEMTISQQLFEICTPEEITAIFLHELGHNIDPALVDIKYSGVDVLIDSMLGRTTSESKIDKLKSKLGIKKKGLVEDVVFTIYVLFLMIITFGPLVAILIDTLIRRFESKEKKMNKIKELLKEANEFNRKNNTEAYADNIARMYGYGAALMTGLEKVGKQNEDIALYSYRKKAKRREKVILDMYIDSLRDVHGTDVQRIVALIKEYETDLKDPSIPDGTKKWIRADKEKLEAVLNAYVNNKDKVKANVNKMIKTAMDGLDSEKDGENIVESVELFEEKHRDDYQSLTAAEREIANERFGKIQCSIMKDKDGYFARTHRMRSKSYTSLEKLPISVVERVSSSS